MYPGSLLRFPLEGRFEDRRESIDRVPQTCRQGMGCTRSRSAKPRSGRVVVPGREPRRPCSQAGCCRSGEGHGSGSPVARPSQNRLEVTDEVPGAYRPPARGDEHIHRMLSLELPVEHCLEALRESPTAMLDDRLPHDVGHRHYPPATTNLEPGGERARRTSWSATRSSGATRRGFRSGTRRALVASYCWTTSSRG